MPHHHMPNRLRCRKSLLALAAGAALLPSGAWALDLAQSPPASVKPYVAPNVIMSFDNSGSMLNDIEGCYTTAFLHRYNETQSTLQTQHHAWWELQLSAVQEGMLMVR